MTSAVHTAVRESAASNPGTDVLRPVERREHEQGRKPEARVRRLGSQRCLLAGRTPESARSGATRRLLDLTRLRQMRFALAQSLDREKTTPGIGGRAWVRS